MNIEVMSRETQRADLVRRGRWLEYFTLGYNYLSAILLGGLLLNALLGWWWADPVAALVMVPIIVKEGIEALRGETCCDEGASH